MAKSNKNYAMKMGSKQTNTPSAFNMKDAATIAASPVMMHKPGHEGYSEASKPIMNLSEGVYQHYEGIESKGGQARGGYPMEYGGGDDEAFSSTKKGLPKGVFQDYLKSGGSTNPRVAANIMKRAVDYADSQGGNISRFKKTPEKGYGTGHWGRSFYAPKKGFTGIDPQTGKTTHFGLHGKSSPKVQKYSSDFQDHMRAGIAASKPNKITTKGVAAASQGIKASTLKESPLGPSTPSAPAKKKVTLKKRQYWDFSGKSGVGKFIKKIGDGISDINISFPQKKQKPGFSKSSIPAQNRRRRR